MRCWQIRKRNLDLARGLQSDLELEEEEQRENGLPGSCLVAGDAFRNPTLIKERVHEPWGWTDSSTSYGTFATRSRHMRKSPGAVFAFAHLFSPSNSSLPQWKPVICFSCR